MRRPRRTSIRSSPASREPDVPPPQPGTALDEFDTAAFDRRAAAWLLARWHEQGLEVHGDAGALRANIRDHLHPVSEIVEQLGEAGFTCGEVERIPYLYRWHLEPGLLEAEVNLIEAGELPLTGARFSATPAGRTLVTDPGRPAAMVCRMRSSLALIAAAREGLQMKVWTAKQ